MVEPLPPVGRGAFALAICCGLLLAIGVIFVTSEVLHAAVQAAHAVRGLPR